MITAEEMRGLEDRAEKGGISRLVLMERAGKGISDEIKKRFGKTRSILFICYHGNNGGDGFTAARYLLEDNYNAQVLFIGDKERLANEAKVNYGRLPSMVFVTDFFEADVIVDCMLGIGSAGRLKEPIRSYVEKINKAGSFILSVDMPTGLGSDIKINADLVITLHDIKPGLDKNKTVIVDIGLPKAL